MLGIFFFFGTKAKMGKENLSLRCRMNLQASSSSSSVISTITLLITTRRRRSRRIQQQQQQHQSSSNYSIRTFCSKGNSPEPKQNGDSNNGDKFSTDWDKAWSKYRKQGKKTTFSKFSPNKYVSWNPRPSNYPLSEEVDPIKRTERSNLRLWTSPEFTLGGAIVIVTFLLIYTILAPVK